MDDEISERVCLLVLMLYVFLMRFKKADTVLGHFPNFCLFFKFLSKFSAIRCIHVVWLR